MPTMTQMNKSSPLVSGLRVEAGSGWMLKHYNELVESAQYVETPPFPREVLVEVANVCNHACTFCAYSKMTRERGFIEEGTLLNIVKQAYELGAREVGLYAGAEPLTYKHLDGLIELCRKVGYERVYITTNGSIGDEKRFRKLIDAGLDSIKFSINGGDRETYKKIHGRDHFERVIANIRFVSEYRKTLDRPFLLGASFVETNDNRHSLTTLKALLEPLVDDLLVTPAYNQNGQMPELPAPVVMRAPCFMPFTRLNISREGYVRLCCNDYQNHLAVGDATKYDLKTIWNGDRFREIRRRHLQNDIKGTLCSNCLSGCNDPIKPLNPELSSLEQIK